MGDATKPAEPAVPKTSTELRALLKRTQAGDESAVPLVRKMLADPAAVDLFGGDLARLAEESFITALSSKDVGFREAVTAKLARMRADLAGDHPTPVERLLAARVVACWLQVQDAELRYAQGQKELSIRQADFHQRRIDAANRRYLAALKTLAQVRKLAVPVLQVNIAERQVNFAAPAAAQPLPGGG